jgi:hypothetical protein
MGRRTPHSKSVKSGIMPLRIHDDDDWDKDEGWGDDSSPEEKPAVPCPYCRRLIPEDVPRCPYCENYISEEDAPPSAKPWWIVVGALVSLVVVYFWIVH